MLFLVFEARVGTNLRLAAEYNQLFTIMVAD
jgi:hypothetical protein